VELAFPGCFFLSGILSNPDLQNVIPDIQSVQVGLTGATTGAARM